jgi:hypothetical protein
MAMTRSENILQLELKIMRLGNEIERLMHEDPDNVSDVIHMTHEYDDLRADRDALLSSGVVGQTKR